MRTSFMIRRWWIWVVFIACFRLAHINLLWSDEDYHLAAAIRILHGQVPYRDFWYDKPSLPALFYLLIGGMAGWPLRVLDVLFVLAACWVAYRFALAWWSENEGRTAALLLAFFTTFYLTSATVPFAVDGLLLLPHLGAVYFAFQRRALWSGICCASGMLTNVKAVFVVATCGLWLLGELPVFGLGLLTPLLAAALLGLKLDVWGDFYQQVWQWGLVYTTSQNSLGVALRRCADWMGFHLALVAGLLTAGDEFGFRTWAWLALSCAPLLLGSHFAPRYFFQVLPVLVILGSRGIVVGLRRFEWKGGVVLAVMLLVPLVRFGPRYGELIWEREPTNWADAALDVDSRKVADVINSMKRAGDTLFVWGYRPDVYVYTRMTPDGKFSDSQALDGVAADRHLQSSMPASGMNWQANRSLLVNTRPTFLVDGLGLLNPDLRMDKFTELAGWLRKYRLVGTTRLSRIYVRAESKN